jgi:virginiamycin B lyase
MKTTLAFALLTFSAAAAAQGGLPEGPGKALVQARCTACHDLSNITRSSYSREEWDDNVHKMRNVGAQLSDGEMEAVVNYLAKGFPERPRPQAVLIPGGAKVTIAEWAVPTLGSRPHDPLVARDGSLWYTGQFANLLGRLDPATGEIREYPLKTPQSGPHGLVEDGEGRIWFTANMKGYIGMLDPKSGSVKEYPLGEPEARDPHSLAFDARGRIFFTVQGGNRIGRLDPASGEVKMVVSRTPRSRPYGIVVNSKGVPFVVLFGTNKVARVDPETLDIREYELPDAGARPRRIALTSDDVVWYTDYARGYLGRLDPGTGKVTEWKSPGGPQSQPYGMLSDRDVIWYSESNVKPNTLVRFDPKDASFQTWAIPSGGGVIRNMMHVREGRFGIACSGVNKVGLVVVAN